MKELISQFLNARGVRFLISGGSAALLAWTSRIIFDVFTSFDCALILSSTVSVTYGFFVYKIFVYKNTEIISKAQISKYIMVNAIGAIITIFTSILLLRSMNNLSHIPFKPELSHLGGIFISSMLNYKMHSAWTFK